MNRLLRVLGALMLLALAACGGGAGNNAGTTPKCSPSQTLAGGVCVTAGPVVHVSVTTADQTRLLATDPDLRFTGTAAGSLVIDVDSSIRYQTMIGVGAALTDASAYVLRHDLTDTQRSVLLNELFTNSGVGANFLRMTIGASDFSRSLYTYDDVPTGQADPSLAAFTLAALDVDVVPSLQEVLSIDPHVHIIASPWSAPAWMKSNDSLVHSSDPSVNGTLRSEYYAAHAQYLVDFINGLTARGVPLFGLTVQNEPGYEPVDYPGMLLPPAARVSLLGNYLGPALAQAAPSVKVLEYDHNWDDPSSPSAVLSDPAANAAVSGVAWHCYAGDVSAQSTVHNAYPAKDAYITECSGGGWAPVWKDNFSWVLSNLIIGGARNWARGVLLWNLVLDETSGPHTGGCSNCRGVVTVQSSTGAITRNEEYYALAHYGRFVHDGAIRIQSSAAQNGLQSVAFLNPDDGSHVLLALNASTQSLTFSVRESALVFDYTLPAGAAVTFRWTP